MKPSRENRHAGSRLQGGDRRGCVTKPSGCVRDVLPQNQPVPFQVRRNATQPIRVLKFGGTSLGDASCIERAAEIIRVNLRESDVVVVVSAMSGVTNKLFEAVTCSETGDLEAVATIFERLRKQHTAAANTLIHSAPARSRIRQKMRELFQEGERLCRETKIRGEMTLEIRDAIASLGERLSAPLVAAVLTERGVASEAIEATELVVTDSRHGAADPQMELTRERCEARLHPLLRQHVVPVITGFIGATPQGLITTLGRGGSDYSATILGAALEADEVAIWTDVDGLLTADPRLVPDACTIPEISYREAADLAHFGAKVLHPKTLRAVTPHGIPVWIRNTFAPKKPGTKLTPSGPPTRGGVTALSAISDVALISIGPSIMRSPNVLDRALATAAVIRADVLLRSQSASHDDIWLVVPSSCAKRTVEALRREFAQDIAARPLEEICHGGEVAIVTVVGQNIGGMSGVTERAMEALGCGDVNVLASTQTSLEHNISFVVHREDMKVALLALHKEFELAARNSQDEEITSGDLGSPRAAAL